MILGGLFGKREQASTAETPKEWELPYDVRYAMRYRESRMAKPELNALNRNHHEREALYLAFKAAASDKQLHMTLMQEAVAKVSSLQFPTDSKERNIVINTTAKELAEKAIQALPETVTVQGQKLATLSRYGFTLWYDTYEECAERHAQAHSETFVLAHSPFVGLISFIDAFRRANKPLHIFVPAFISDPDNSSCGYRIQNGIVELLPKSFKRSGDSVIIDDAVRTGDSANLVRDFWMAGEQYQLPAFEFLSLSGTDKATRV